MKQSSIVNEIKRRVARHGQAQVARDLGITQSMMSRIISGHRQPGPKVAAGLGMVAHTVFRPIPADER